MNWKKDIPGWVVIIVVLLTAAITAWAMLQNGQNLGWNGDPNQPYPPRDFVKLMSPSIAGAEAGNLLNVAAVGAVPVIRAGSVPPHGERGVCTSCHTVVDSRGSTIPTIGTRATMPHAFRGVCSNCHLVNGALPGGANPWGNGGFGPAPLAANTGNFGTQGATKTATEGEWLGIEVAPITKLTADQYNIPPNVGGLVVPEAEAQAATAGIKAGDVIVSVNGIPTRNITEFFRATKNGTLAEGDVEILRGGQRMVARLGGQTGAGATVGQNQNWTGPQIANTTPNASNNSLQTQDGNVPVGLMGPGGPGYGLGLGPGGGQGLGLGRGLGLGATPGRTCPAQM